MQPWGLLAFQLLLCRSGSRVLAAQVTFGEFPAFVTLSGLLLEYALGMAAVARGFSFYLALLVGADPEAPPFEFQVENGESGFDVMAAAIIMVGDGQGRMGGRGVPQVVLLSRQAPPVHEMVQAAASLLIALRPPQPFCPWPDHERAAQPGRARVGALHLK